MIKPTFICGSINITVEDPSGWEVRVIEGKSTNTTLNGTLVKDVAWRKFEYVLVWDTMSVADYELLIDLYKEHIDNNTDITFKYDKWNEPGSGVLVSMEMPSRTKNAGSGNVQYWSKVTITLTEKVKRTS